MSADYTPSEAEVEAAARAAALHDDYDGCFERVDEYEALLAEFPDDYRSGDERPDSDYEDCEWWRNRVRPALVAAHAVAPASQEGVGDDDPVCVCGLEWSGHSGWDNHAFVGAEDYFSRTSAPREDVAERIAQAIEKADRKDVDWRVADIDSKAHIVDRVLAHAARIARSFANP